MMTTPQTMPDLIAASKAEAKISEDQILAIRAELNGKADSKTQTEDLRAAYLALEATAVDCFSVFEARMQHHFKRGPFSRKLKSALLEAGRTDLAGRLHQYYLAINVLKHGTGASYRELLNTRTDTFHVKSAEGSAPQEENTPSVFLDVEVPGFFAGLSETLLEAHQFLEKR
ncbi:hypothetical protein L0666_13055 [Octadecabacter sp. CECT 8868]|uniref:hypothetical protein n=1 Tax=Octadecabacter algicola TaxID=2909342 RepID=UPI001F419B7C|nr:hypothetical protein [Octadecabacter algicola]MCF2905921.1 hypothetical protein [Octadecabacter algicola]